MTNELSCCRRGDLGRLAIILLLAVGTRAWMVANTTVPSRDAIVFIRYALELESPPPLEGKFKNGVLRGEEHPPGYPVAVLAMSKIVRPQMGGTSVESMALSAQLVSAIAGVLLAIPLYFTVRRILGPNAAFAAVGLFEVLPVFVEVTSDGISDGLFLLTVATALWFAVRALECENPRSVAVRSALSGLCCGVGYLIRPEGLVVEGAIGVTFLGVLIGRYRGRTNWKIPLVAGLALTAGAAAAELPYMVHIGGITNKPTGKQFASPDEFQPTFPDRGAGRPGVQIPLAAWWSDTRNAGENRLFWAAKAVFKEYTKTAHYAAPVIGLLGLIAVWPRLRDPRLALFVVLGTVFGLVHFLLAYRAGYVSQRHMLIETMVTCVFVGAALTHTSTIVARLRPGRSTDDGPAPPPRWAYWGCVVLVVLMASALPRNFRSLHSERAGHKAAGQWLAENADPKAHIIDPFGWTEWYAGRSLHRWTNEDRYEGPFVYVVFEPNATSPHSRLGLYDLAKDLAEKGTIIYQYPPDASPQAIKVAVYKAPMPPQPRIGLGITSESVPSDRKR